MTAEFLTAIHGSDSEGDSTERQVGYHFCDGAVVECSIRNTCPIHFNFLLLQRYDRVAVPHMIFNLIATGISVAYYRYFEWSADFWSSSNKFRAVIRALKTCSVAFIDARNGFLTKFHIEIVIQFFSQLFFSSKKIIFFENENKKKQKKHFFKKIFLIIFKKYYFFQRKKCWDFFLDYYFDVEFCQESISGIYKCNGAVLKALITALNLLEDDQKSVDHSKYW